MPKRSLSSRSGVRQARREQRIAAAQQIKISKGTEISSGYQALTPSAVQRIHATALDLLERVGMGAATERVKNLALAHGCSLTEEGRLLFPRTLVEDCIARAAKQFTVHGRDPKFDFEARTGKVNFCTGGAAVQMLDIDTRSYRASTLNDLYDLARLCDTLESIQWFARPIIATDVHNPLELDVNTIYTCAAGTKKHIATSIVQGDHVVKLLPLLDYLAGGEGAYAQRPFCSVHATTVVSPMAFAPDSLDVVCAAVDIGMPIHCQTGPQAGATAPAALAGTLAQICAEGLASLTIINLLKPGHPAILGLWALVSDLRTGAFSGGGAEQALLGAAAGQMSAFYGIPGGMGAGMSDSKLPDNQAGFEKALSVVLAALSGSGFVYESAGMLASLLGCSCEAMIIDDEMLSGIRRIARGIEVNEDTLSAEVIAEAVTGPGHFLDSAQTLALMETEFVYPRHADRCSPEVWAEAGSQDIWERARLKAQEILRQRPPALITAEMDADIRAQYTIHLQPFWVSAATP